MSKEYSIQQVNGNNGENGNPLWIILDNKVYDVSKFEYPDGKTLSKKGEERKEEFINLYGKNVKDQSVFIIGTVKSANEKTESKTDDTKDDIEGREKKECPFSKCKGYSKPMIIIGVVVSALAVGLGAYFLKKR